MDKVTIIKENRNAGGAVYGLGLIGALVYYWQHASTFGQVVLGLLKSIVWPAILIYHALQRIGG
jgi:hypothetical protein